jgi:glycine/D-amino acid oxidase-like deaminating enzyme
MLQEAAAVIIGSGALGSSVAFHLARAGLTPVVLLDKHEIASQTSPRAAGLTAQIRQSELMTRLAKTAVDKIRNFTVETGEELIYFQSGSLKIARTSEHEDQLRRDVERGRALGVDVDLVSHARARELMPFFEPVGVRAVTHVPGDLYLEPGQLPRGYANAMAKLGGVLLPNTNVSGLIAENGRIAKVVTDQGEIQTPIVVDAAGAWTRLIASLAGTRVGAIATRHQLLITQPIPGMVGGYESDPLQLDMASLPSTFSIDDLPLDLSVLRRLIDRVADQFPILRDMAVKQHRGGLPTMTPDGEHIVGPLPDLRGFYVAGGCCVGGLSIAPIIGDLLAEWIVCGKPSVDLSPLSPARLAVQTSVESALLDDCRRQYAFHYWPKQA